MDPKERATCMLFEGLSSQKIQDVTEVFSLDFTRVLAERILAAGGVELSIDLGKTLSTADARRVFMLLHAILATDTSLTWATLGGDDADEVKKLLRTDDDTPRAFLLEMHKDTYLLYLEKIQKTAKKGGLWRIWDEGKTIEVLFKGQKVPYCLQTFGLRTDIEESLREFDKVTKERREAKSREILTFYQKVLILPMDMRPTALLLLGRSPVQKMRLGDWEGDTFYGSKKAGDYIRAFKDYIVAQHDYMRILVKGHPEVYAGLACADATKAMRVTRKPFFRLFNIHKTLLAGTKKRAAPEKKKKDDGKRQRVEDLVVVVAAGVISPLTWEVPPPPPPPPPPPKKEDEAADILLEMYHEEVSKDSFLADFIDELTNKNV